MKKFFTFFLLAAVIFNAGAYLFGLSARQWLHKFAVESLMDSGKLSSETTIIRMTRSQFDEIKIHEREFRLNNEMYDVLYKTESNDTLTLYCFRDVKEENLIIEFLGFIAEHTNENSASSTLISRAVMFGFALFFPEYHNSNYLFAEADLIPLPFPSKTLAGLQSVETPPPRNTI